MSDIIKYNSIQIDIENITMLGITRIIYGRIIYGRQQTALTKN